MHSMNYHWPYRGVQHPYPPSAPPAQQNQVSSSATQAAPATSLPYPQVHAGNASNYTAPASSYTNPATGYHPAAAASSSTYATTPSFQTSSQPATGNSYSSATGTPHQNYASAVTTQRQPSTVDSQIQQQQPTRPTVTPGTPLSTAGSASYTSANNTNFNNRNLSAASGANQSQSTPQPSRQEEQRSAKGSYPAPAAQSTSSSAKQTPSAQVPSAAAAAPKRKSMGRLGDADVHSAFYEFKNKETDKCLSAQCLHCHSVRAKNTSRQRQHLMECQLYLNHMREENPNHPILKMAAEHAAGTPMKDIIKSNTGGSGGGGGGGQAVANNANAAGNMTPVNGTLSTPNGHAMTNGTPTQAPKRQKVDHHETNTIAVTSSLGSGGFAGNSMAPSHGLPAPKLERDFQMAVQLNVQLNVGKATWGQEYWTSYVSGHWNGRWGKGIVTPGGQDVQNSILGGGTHTESRLLLQTHDAPPAYIAVKMHGWRTASRDVLDRLSDPSQADGVDPREYTHRCFISMETGDERYKDLNTAMWLGTVIRKTHEAVYDAYRIS